MQYHVPAGSLIAVYGAGQVAEPVDILVGFGAAESLQYQVPLPTSVAIYGEGQVGVAPFEQVDEGGGGANT